MLESVLQSIRIRPSLKESRYSARRSGSRSLPKPMSKAALRNAEGPKPRVASRRRITDYDINMIVQIVRQWPTSPITWEAIVEKVERELAAGDPEGKKAGLGGWTRQGLSRRPEIKRAYLDRRAELAAEAQRVKRTLLEIETPRLSFSAGSATRSRSRTLSCSTRSTSIGSAFPC